MSPPEQKDGWLPLLLVFGTANLANGAWMLWDPQHWYLNLPANVPGTGPLNEHFVRDIGCIFAMIGAALTIAAWRRSWRVEAMLLASVFYVAHAAVHVVDQWRGLLGANQWAYDLVPVYGGALLLTVLTVKLLREAR